MRVIHVITRLIVGGAQENTIATVLGLHKKPGVDVRLYSGPTNGPEGSLESVVASAGLLTLVPELVRPVSPFVDLKAYYRLKALFRSARPDIVHTHSGKAGIVGRLAAHAARVPCVIHTIHGPSFGKFQGGMANLMFRTAEKIAGRRTHFFVTVADAMRDQYLAAGIGDSGRYQTIRSGFNLKPFLEAKNDLQLRADLGIPADSIVIGKIGRLFTLKGHDDLISAAPSLVAREPRLRFLLVGDGTWRERLQQRITAAGLSDRFIFTGLVRPGDVARYIGIMDILVHLSRREGLPRAVPQALAAAKPVVAADCDGAGEICIHGETGFLVPVGDLRKLEDRLDELIRYPQLRERFGRRGQDLAREQFSEERMVNDIYDLYLRLGAPRA